MSNSDPRLRVSVWVVFHTQKKKEIKCLELYINVLSCLNLGRLRSSSHLTQEHFFPRNLKKIHQLVQNIIWPNSRALSNQPLIFDFHRIVQKLNTVRRHTCMHHCTCAFQNLKGTEYWKLICNVYVRMCRLASVSHLPRRNFEEAGKPVYRITR